MLVALVLLPAAAWLSTYFWMHTESGQSLLLEAATAGLADGLLEVDELRWGPRPDRLWARGVVVRDAAGQPALTAEMVAVDLDLRLGGGPPKVEHLKVQGLGVHLAWDAQGTFNLQRPWLRPEAPDPEAEPADRAPLSLEAVTVRDATVTLTWPTWSLGFSEVSSDGVIVIGGPERLQINASLQGGEALARVGDDVRRFDRHSIDGFQWRERGFRATKVALSTSAGDAITASGRMGFGGGVSIEAKGAAALRGSQGGTPVAQWLPEGGVIDAWAVRRGPRGPWRFEAEGLDTPALQLGAVNLAGLQASFEGDYLPGAVLPRLTLTSSDARSSSVAIDDRLSATGVSLEALDVRLAGGLEASLTTLAARQVSLADDRVDDLKVSATVVANVGGGSVQGTLKSADGAMTLSGPVETSVFRRRALVSVSVAFDRVRAGLAAWMDRLLPDAAQAQAPEPLSGEATGRLEVSASRAPSWTWTSFSWAEGVP